MSARMQALFDQEADTVEDALARSRYFFNEVMKRMNVGASALSTTDLASWNEAAIAVERVCSSFGIEAKEGGQ
jgi:hypothetical protein